MINILTERFIIFENVKIKTHLDQQNTDTLCCGCIILDILMGGTVQKTSFNYIIFSTVL